MTSKFHHYLLCNRIYVLLYNIYSFNHAYHLTADVCFDTTTVSILKIILFCVILRVRNSVYPEPRWVFPHCCDCLPESKVSVCTSLDSGDYEEAPWGSRSHGDRTESSDSPYLYSVSSMEPTICSWNNTSITALRSLLHLYMHVYIHTIQTLLLNTVTNHNLYFTKINTTSDFPPQIISIWRLYTSMKMPTIW